MLVGEKGFDHTTATDEKAEPSGEGNTTATGSTEGVPAEQTIDPKKAANKTPKRAHKAKAAASDNGQCATEKKEFQKLWAEAGQLRKILIPTVAQTSQLLQMIQKNELG